ncbi:MAG: IS21 family transposase [Chloroflexi bacterium]|nr:MAG: IS21 family transposase [Chloroflexota bacterium]
MITVDQKEQIRRAHYIEGKSIRQIQRETGYHRQTIRKALRDGAVPEYALKAPRPSPVMDPVKPIIDQWLAEDEARPPKQRHTAKRIYQRLTTEYGFQGAESTVRRYVGQRRKALRSQVFIPLGYVPGQTAQVDFGTAQAIIAGEELTVQLFCLRLGYSKQPFVTALPTQAQEAFFEGHVRAFDFLGGVPREIVYDNLKAAVKRILEGRNREEQATFKAFRSHYLFDSRFCTPRQAHEKGLVEGLVGYARRNWFVPLPECDTWDELNAYLVDQCRAEGARRLRGMETTIGEALAVERAHLLPLPDHPFACCRQQPVQANGFGLVTFQTNRYSVPADHAHEALWLRAFVQRIEITNGRQTLAVHPRCYGREQDILDPLHYLPLLEQRPGAWEQARPIQEWRQHWPPIYHQYLTAIRQHLPAQQATREFVRILRLHEDYPEAVIAQALETALLGHCYSLDSVKQLVLRLTEPARSVEPLNGSAITALTSTPVEWPDVAQFDRLLQSQAGEDGQGGAA